MGPGVMVDWRRRGAVVVALREGGSRARTASAASMTTVSSPGGARPPELKLFIVATSRIIRDEFEYSCVVCMGSCCRRRRRCVLTIVPIYDYDGREGQMQMVVAVFSSLQKVCFRVCRRWILNFTGKLTVLQVCWRF